MENKDGISLNNVAHPKGSWWSSVKLWLRGFSKGSTVTADASDLVTPARPSYTHTTTKYAGVLNGSHHPYLYIHREGCGRPAWYQDYKPKPMDIARGNGVYRLDGTPIGYGSEMRCGSCGELVRLCDLRSANVVDAETWAEMQRVND